MGLAHKILAQREFNDVVNKFSHPGIDTTVASISDECISMLANEGFVINRAPLDMTFVSLPIKGNTYD